MLDRALLGRKGSSWFALKMRASLVELARQYEPPGDHPRDAYAAGYVRDLMAALLVETITWWLEQGRPYTPQEMAWRCAALASALFKEAGAWQPGIESRI